MNETARSRISQILSDPDVSEQPSAQLEQILPLVYSELKQQAEQLMGRERRDHTLEPSALVHEAFLRLVDQSRVDWRGRTHFRAVAALAMRRVLIDHARSLARQKRGDGWARVTLSQLGSATGSRGLDAEQLLDVERALEKLAALDARQAKVVELRFFGGLSVAEVAASLGVSRRTVEGDWSHARIWLIRELRN